ARCAPAAPRLVVVGPSRDAAGGLESEDVLRRLVGDPDVAGDGDRAEVVVCWEAEARLAPAQAADARDAPWDGQPESSPSGKLGTVRVCAATRNGDADGVAVRDPHERG